MKLRLLAIFAVALITAACAGNPPNPYDPYEGYNRPAHSFNTAVDKAIAKPVAKGYVNIVPKTARKGVSNALGNLGDTRNAVVNLTQGELTAALESVHRFVFNSTFGLFGLIDVTDAFNLPPKRANDMGTTYAKMGWANSNYFVVPFMGPSTSRDTVGLVSDVFATPYTYVFNDWVDLGVLVMGAVNLRSELLEVDSVTKSAALDPYVFQREAYLQYRNQQLKNRGVRHIKSAHDRENLYADNDDDYDDDDSGLSIAELARQRSQN